MCVCGSGGGEGHTISAVGKRGRGEGGVTAKGQKVKTDKWIGAGRLPSLSVSGSGGQSAAGVMRCDRVTSSERPPPR